MNQFSCAYFIKIRIAGFKKGQKVLPVKKYFGRIYWLGVMVEFDFATTSRIPHVNLARDLDGAGLM